MRTAGFTRLSRSSPAVAREPGFARGRPFGETAPAALARPVASRHDFGAISVSPPARRPAPAGGEVVQRVVDLEKKYPQDKHPELYENGRIDKYKQIQQILANPEIVRKHLGTLEGTAKGHLGASKRPTRALERALRESETSWMGEEPRVTIRNEEKPGKQNEIVSAKGPYEFQKQFLSEVVSKGAPFKDVGAPVPHGEYAHRLQWHVISQEMGKDWGEEGLRDLHKHAGKLDYLQDLEKPAREDDPNRSLWDYVMDVRKEEPPEVGKADDVLAASPIRLTSDLLGYSPGKPGEWSKDFPTLAHAVANKRRKRALENKAANKRTEAENSELQKEGGWKKRQEWLAETFPDHFEDEYETG